MNIGQVFRITLIHSKFWINVRYSFALLFRCTVVSNQNNFSFPISNEK